jgi:signal transduction histidine kinase
MLELVALGERLRVHLPGVVDLARVSPLVDAHVRLRGVYRANFTARRQLVGVEIHVPSFDLVTVLSPAPAAPYAAPLRRSDSVLEFHPRDATGRRIHVQGVVTLHRPGRFLYLRDAGGPLRVETRGQRALGPGDEIDVVGFPGLGEYRPLLADASYRTRGKQPAPEPLAVRADQAMSGDLDGELIRIEGTLVERFAPEGETRLVLQSPLHVFEAALPDPGAFDAFRRGSRLSVTGIAAVKGDAARVPQSFQLLLRSAADVVMIEPAPWWTPQRAILAVASLLGVAAFAFAWVGTLHRRVREQTEILRSRLGREAALEERTRLARELHDTVEQNLAGIGYALEAVKHTLEHPTVARAHLDRALQHVDQSMGDARRSVSALRPRALEEGGLSSALSSLAGEVARGGMARAEVDVSGQPWPLVPAVEDHLFRIGQEAVTNALKHAHANRLQIRLGYAETAFELAVLDDGCGFDSARPLPKGHFGIIGMRERAAKLGATIELQSRSGEGTTVVVRVPRQAASLPQVS